MYQFGLRRLLFLLPSETAHHVAMGIFALLLKIPLVSGLLRAVFKTRSAHQPCTVFGLHFPNRLGIAAGFDKNGTYIKTLAVLGFGCIEIGSVTPRPQAGNPKPRLFRLIKSRALINRMGFNNDGCEIVAKRLQQYQQREFILGANIGKNKDTPNANAVDDYLACFNALHAHVDYFVINVSSPNTPGLRELQDRDPLMEILSAVQDRNGSFPQPKPVLLKIAPDLTQHQLDDIATLVQEVKLDGLVVTNTTLARTGLQESDAYVSSLGNGGLSGAPLRSRATEVLQYMKSKLPNTVVLIGVGGIDSGESALERLQAGATLVQIYTGFIYEGPGLVKRILRHIAEK